MNKRLICILLCVVMLAGSVFMTSCDLSDENSAETSEGDGEQTSIDRSSMTLSLWLPRLEGTTDEAVSLVEEAINNITQDTYDTAIKLYAIPEAEYDKVLRERLELIETRTNEENQAAINKRKAQVEAAKKGESYVEETTVFENTNMDGDYSLVVRGATGYANVERNQLDIFLIHGVDDYHYYADNLYIEALDGELTNTCKVLKSYIYPDFFDAAVYENSTYCVPNNHEIGEYTYFLVNKKLVEEEYLNPDKLLSLSDCQELIEDCAKYHKDYTPIYGEYSPSYYRFFSGQDQKTFSVLASRVLYSTTVEDLSFDNIFNFNNYTTNYYLYKNFTEKGYVSKTEPDKFAVGYITCLAKDIQKYADDYYIITYLHPEGTQEDYLASAFAVSSYTKSVPRSMEIITMINTNTKLRTILQYGVEGTHWKYDEEDSSIIVKLSDEYKMPLLDTGNEFITYPDYGVGLDGWEAAKSQNLDSYYPVTASFEYQNETNAELLKTFDAYNAQIKARIEKMSAEEFKSSINSLATETSKNDAYQKLTYIPSDNDEKKGRTEEKGWFTDASISYLWQQVYNAYMGFETE